jgi:nitroimidazol reductase NimA-like FMN-containing flavoprotein (pyridoxamine 5'-phosphate oxidase superfamily)
MLELDRSECLHLLATSSLGRLAVNLGDGPPVIRPVNFVFDAQSQSVVVRTGLGSKFHALANSANAAFEVDGTDATGRIGWSVIILGATEEITNQRELDRLAGLGLDPGVPGLRTHWFAIRARTVSGRRIVMTRPDLE